MQSAFKYAMLNHNLNISARRFELQAYVDVINTADAFKLSRLSRCCPERDNTIPHSIPFSIPLYPPLYTSSLCSFYTIYIKPRARHNKARQYTLKCNLNSSCSALIMRIFIENCTLYPTLKSFPPTVTSSLSHTCHFNCAHSFTCAT